MSDLSTIKVLGKTFLNSGGLRGLIMEYEPFTPKLVPWEPREACFYSITLLPPPSPLSQVVQRRSATGCCPEFGVPLKSCQLQWQIKNCLVVTEMWWKCSVSQTGISWDLRFWIVSCSQLVILQYAQSDLSGRDPAHLCFLIWGCHRESSASTIPDSAMYKKQEEKGGEGDWRQLSAYLMRCVSLDATLYCTKSGWIRLVA